MPTITAELTDPRTTVDAPTGSKVRLKAPAAVNSPTWTKNSEAFDPPDDFLVEPAEWADDVYAATEDGKTWSAVVRWQPGPPTDVAAAAGKANVTVSWTPGAAEEQLAYYQVTLDREPETAHLPRNVLRGAGPASARRRKVRLDGLPPNLYEASVKSARTGEYGDVTSEPAKSSRVEVLPAARGFSTAIRAILFMLAVLVASFGVVEVLLVDPGSDTSVSLDSWAIEVALLATITIALVIAVITNPLGLITGPDSRISTSRVNVAVWTVVVAFGILTLAAFAFGAQRYHEENPCGLSASEGTEDDRTLDGICLDGTPVEASALDFDSLFEDGLAPNYLVLLGAPFVTLAGAAFIVNRQVESGERQKVPASGPARFTDALTNDDGSADLVDSQYLVFTGVLLFYFFTTFLTSPSALPELPWGLVGLTGVSAGTYLLNKSVSTNGLTVTSLASPSTSRDGSNRVLGRNFLPEGSAALPHGGVTVMLDAITAPVTKVTDTEIEFRVPEDVETKVYNVRVTTAAGVSASAGQLKVT